MKKRTFLLLVPLVLICIPVVLRIVLFDAYLMPTGSMEGTLLINDYLWVNKLAYKKNPTDTGTVQRRYNDWACFGSVKRNDIITFRYPCGDTILAENPEADYYFTLRNEFGNDRQLLCSRYTVKYRTTNQEEIYIKRCVALPGDKVEIRDAMLYINGQPATAYPHQHLLYIVKTKGAGIPDDVINDNDIEVLRNDAVDNSAILSLANDQVAMIKKLPQVVAVTPMVYPSGYTENGGTFPHDTTNFKWSRDNFGPLTIPKAGVTVQLTPQNIALYRRVIVNYEGNRLIEREGTFVINGKQTNTYTFKMNYYWVLGDNRDNSMDSRYWGFVPVDHVMGRVSFVWYSYSRSDIRWGRMFHSISSLEQ